jgi:hypothetical protein
MLIYLSRWFLDCADQVVFNDTLIVGPLTASIPTGQTPPATKPYRRWGVLVEAWTPTLPAEGHIRLHNTTVIQTAVSVITTFVLHALASQSTQW